MPEMTKKEFAARLLFWLLPWPISRALPRALRIYYFGPDGGPAPGWYDFWGFPAYLWPDAPPYDGFIDKPPVEPPPWWPIDPYNPPPPGKFPEPPDGPGNVFDPYTPGHDLVPHPPHRIDWLTIFDNTYWQCKQYCDWTAAGWELGGDAQWKQGAIEPKTGTTWAVGYRPTKLRMFFTATELIDLIFFAELGLCLCTQNDYKSGQILNVDFSGYDRDIAHLFVRSGPITGVICTVTSIQFL